MRNLCVQPCDDDSFIPFADVTHSLPFQCKIRVDPQQINKVINHVNNIEYLRWIDKGAQLHADACGWTHQRLQEAGMMWFVARHEIEYLAEVTGEDNLRLTTWVDDIRRVKSWRSTLIHALADPHKTVCRCRTLWVLVDLASRRPITIPKAMAIALKPRIAPRLAKA